VHGDLAIETEGLSRDFGALRAVDGLDLAVRRGELFGFLGPNGSGKTTTIRMLTGLLRISRGRARVDGFDVGTDLEAVRRRIGLVPDTPPLYDHLTGWQYLAFVASLWGVDRAQRDAAAERLFAVFELEEAAGELCRTYSHGMRKKLHVAAVLATRPQVLFLDEPTNGLDPRSARRLKDHLRESRDAGTTIFLTTHLLSLAEELCDRVAIVSRGRKLCEGPVAELVERSGERDLEDVFLKLTEPESGDVEAAPA
jgi:ABC-2 type transport system ATP-binding protein